MPKKKFTIATVLALATLLFITTAPLLAQGNVLHQGVWSKKGFDISGTWKIVSEGGKNFVVLDEAFKTKKAPDLKIFLTAQPLADATGSNATRGAVLVGPLKNHRGAQRLEIPAGTDLSKFKTILLHCEKYSKLWGGANLSS